MFDYFFSWLAGSRDVHAPSGLVPVASDDMDLMVTLWPSFPHFVGFADNTTLAGIRLNSAMINLPDLERELATIKRLTPRVPLYFDIKGRQLRVEEVLPNKHYLDIRLNHPIKVKTPVEILLKAGADAGRLGELSEGGYRLTFDANPEYSVRAGESIHIRHPSFELKGNQFTNAELGKIEAVRAAGIDRWFLSYVQCQRDVDEFRELIGPDALLMLKIEDLKGLRYVREEFKKDSRTRLVAAFGDLYVEVERPHDILKAAKLIVEKDRDALAGSRMLLSVVSDPVPSLADFAQLAWLYEIGYRHAMLCDEICLDGKLLSVAVNAFNAFREGYTKT